jgi:hypothetical protein
MITPDTKDWTWVLETPCPDCGYDAGSVPPGTIGDRVRAALPRWQAVLQRRDATDRPAPDVWSPAEYACHVRDVFRIFDERLRLMLSVDDARFSNWDQDVTALEDRYAERSPAEIGPGLRAAGEQIAVDFDAVAGEQWDRVALRSDGARFTTASFGRYFLHEPMWPDLHERSILTGQTCSRPHPGEVCRCGSSR